MRFLKTLFVLAVLVAGLGAAALWWEAQNFAAPGPAVAETTVFVRPGMGLGVIANVLEREGVVDNALLFRAGVMRRDAATALKAGEYAIPAKASMAKILDMLIRHEIVQHRITIAEGLTTDMVVALVKAHPDFEGEVTAVPPEGSLLPETYLFERGTTRDQILRDMHAAQEKLLAELWPKRKMGLPYTTQQEALTLASIVEKETGIATERPRIAAVFMNRLRFPMRLESDPTIIYGLTKGVPLGRGLRQSELMRRNPYSTYQIDGLPPTPIANPGRDAIAAVLNPPDTKELYFVADGSGGHAFAETYAEHQRNVANWRRIEQANGQ